MSEMGKRRIIVESGPDALAQRAADMFAERAVEGAVSTQFTVALSGGSTPRLTYQALAQRPQEVPWDRTQVFFSDERFVPPDSQDSNYRMANEVMLSHVPIPKRFVHRVPTEGIEPGESAALYAGNIRDVLQSGLAATPAFDLILLGLGPDGHTASLFPDTEALSVEDRIVAANFVPQVAGWRVTFTYPLINAAKAVTFLVVGADKADVVRRALSGDGVPAGRVQPQGDLIWMLDAGAASKLPPGVAVE